VRHELCPHRIVAADVIWTNWSRAFDDFGLHLSSPSNPFFPAALGEQFPLHWRDTVSLRLGFEQHLERGRVLRCGYVYHRNPIPAETLTPFIQGITEHGFSAGYGFVVRRWNVDLAYMYQFGPEVQVGQSEFVGGDFDQSTHRGQTHAICVSLMRQF
jgi:long-subunit fatty acid transport protein